MKVLPGEARNCQWKLAVHDDESVSLVLKLTRSSLVPRNKRSVFSALTIDEGTGIKVLCDGQEVELKLKVEVTAELTEKQIINRHLQVAAITIPANAGHSLPHIGQDRG